jgi:hypothetical protein
MPWHRPSAVPQAHQDLPDLFTLACAQRRPAERLGEPDQVRQGQPRIEQPLMEQGRSRAGRRRTWIGELAVDEPGGLAEPGLLAAQAPAGLCARLVERDQGQAGQSARPGPVRPLGPP